MGSILLVSIFQADPFSDSCSLRGLTRTLTLQGATPQKLDFALRLIRLLGSEINMHAAILRAYALLAFDVCRLHVAPFPVTIKLPGRHSLKRYLVLLAA